MEIDSLVTALERIDRGLRDFLRLSDMPGAPALLHDVLTHWSAELERPYSLDPAFDCQRAAVHQACVVARNALELLAVEGGPVPHVLVREVRELSTMIGSMLPALVRAADRG